MTQQTIYPPAVETKLQLIWSTSKNLDWGLDIQLREDAMRSVFGPFLLEMWLANNADEMEVSMNTLDNLIKRSAAVSLLNSLIDKGYVDTLESEEGDVVFLTSKGREALDNPIAYLLKSNKKEVLN